ncbi:hypothetical protein JCM8547_001147 [Rhodosporidiobolus lusitaniae]
MSRDDRFEDAVHFVTASDTPTSNQTKLRLYALYKVATASVQPTTARPGIFDFTGRAKWDAWAALGKEFEGEGEEGARERARREYMDEAKRLGWTGGGARSPEEGKVEEVPVKEEKKERMVAVSVLESGFVDEAPPSKLHELAISGDVPALDAYLQGEGKSVDLNVLDSYGYTALHLSVDRGNLEAARTLLAAGADKTITDEDGNTALDLARLAEQDELVTLLSS